MAIQTNISLTQTQKEYFQRFVNLSVNEEALPQGDGTIRISPFDDYFLFTIFDEIDGEDTPIDLSNVGNIFINFISDSDEIVVKNHTQVAEIDLSKGEVLFRITKSDSKKVLALTNNNFYISTKMISDDDGSISDESILYHGTWLAFDDASRITLTSQIEEQRLEYSIILAKLQDEITATNAKNTKLLALTTQNELTIQTLQASNDEMTNEISELAENIESAKITEINRRAKAAQKRGNVQRETNQQLIALEKTDLSLVSAGGESFFALASKNLQKYTT
jgi:hypothetical protein